MKKMVLFGAIAASLAIAGCATPHVVDETKTSDAELSCNSLRSEIDEAKRFEQQARQEKGVTGTNVVAGLLFWPAIIGTYSNANEAIEAAKDRQEHLRELYEEKDC